MVVVESIRRDGVVLHTSNEILRMSISLFQNNKRTQGICMVVVEFIRCDEACFAYVTRTISMFDIMISESSQYVTNFNTLDIVISE